MIELQKTYQAGQLIASYAGYLHRGLSRDDAELAAERYKSEFPDGAISIVEIEPGKWGAAVFATTETQVFEVSDDIDSEGGEA